MPGFGDDDLRTQTEYQLCKDLEYRFCSMLDFLIDERAEHLSTTSHERCRKLNEAFDLIQDAASSP